MLYDFRFCRLNLSVLLCLFDLPGTFFVLGKILGGLFGFPLFKLFGRKAGVLFGYELLAELCGLRTKLFRRVMNLVLGSSPVFH